MTQQERQMWQEDLNRWAALADEAILPPWEAIPDFGLYMDQVVTLLQQQFSPLLPTGADKNERIISASAINNYVRLKIMPAPVKRKYYRVHLAYLLMILPMKLSLGIGDIPRLLPPDLEEARVQTVYGDFTGQFHRTALFFTQQMRTLLAEAAENTAERLILESVLLSSFAHLFAGKLLAERNDPPAV